MFARAFDVPPPHIGLLAIALTILVLSVGALTAVPIAPAMVLCILTTGALLLSDSRLSSVERAVLVPAVGMAAHAVSSLLLPLLSALELVPKPAHSPPVLVAAFGLPTVVSIIYWSTRAEPAVPTVRGSPRLLLLLLPVALGASGALLQQQLGFVVQNYVVMGCLVVLVPLLLYWAETELETAASLFVLALGTLLSHTLVTGYSVGVDVQMSLHTIDQVTATGVWSVNDVFFYPGVRGEPVTEIIDYIGSDLSHTGLPVIIGIPVLFEQLGNVSPDSVFDVVYAGIFALTPVAVYRIGRERLSVQEAFVAGAVVIAYYRFFHTSPAKQHLAQFFVGALLVMWHTNTLNRMRRVAITLLAIGIVFSHYAVTFLFLGFLVFSYLFIRWFRDSSAVSNISLFFVGYFYSLVLLWYVVITGGQKPLTALSALAISAQKLVAGGGAQHRSGADVASSQTLLIDQINLGLHGLLLAAIGIGVLGICYHTLRSKDSVFTQETDALAVCLFGLVAASLFVTGHLGIDRALDIGLVVLAPVAVYGVSSGVAVVEPYVSRVSLTDHVAHVGLVFVVLLFALSSGLAYEAAGESATSAVNLHEEPNSVLYTDAEYEGAAWVMANRNNSTVYAGKYASTTFHRFSGRALPYLEYYKDYKYDVQVKWNETGYIFVRRSELTTEDQAVTPQYQLQRDQYEQFVRRPETEVAYQNSAVIVLRVTPQDG